MPAPHDGRHELGQNFLTDPTVVRAIVTLARREPGPIVEIGPGGGALTLPLEALGRPLTAIEIDERAVRRLRRRVAPTTTILHRDFLRYRLPRAPHLLVGNLPFHRTTAFLRHILHSGHWNVAVLLVQWEVARRRAGVGGATMMTAQWWPWYDFAVERRVPASAFTPSPGVDGGLLVVTRRGTPLVDPACRGSYQAFVHRVFTARGRGLRRIVRCACPSAPAARVTAWFRRHGITDRHLPRHLTAEQWVELFGLVSPGVPGPRPGARGANRR